MTDGICSIFDCGKPINARGLCKRHYYRLNRYGDPLGQPKPRPRPEPRPKPPCSVDGCDLPHYGKGLCENHYARQRRHGSLHDKRAERRDPLERFWEKVNLRGPVSQRRPDLGQCWLWTDGRNNSGYGSFNLGDGRVVGAHVAAVLLAGDVIPENYEPDHLCGVRHCVRRSHLQVVTATENKRRAAESRWGARTY